ncbi:MAG: urease accessory protein UreF [Magnetococcales bacterium]|nr:urease accessory protein UreF [Magnetococcales bacterium]
MAVMYIVMITPEGILQVLMTWFSPGFPVGAYSYSHGLEWLVESGLVNDEERLRRWVGGCLRHGVARSDGIFLKRAWQTAWEGDMSALEEVALCAETCRPSLEFHLESSAQGTAFMRVVCDAWPEEFITAWHERLVATSREPALAVAIGMAAARHDLPLTSTLTACLHACGANLVSAGVRLIPLGQSAGQRIIARLRDDIDLARETVLVADADDWGSATAMTDWASLKHENQYTRLFRS